MTAVDILIPTYCRPAALSAALATLLGQSFTDFSVHVSDQTSPAYVGTGENLSVLRVLESLGHPAHIYEHTPPRNIAEHRAFLLSQARAPYVLFLDDDVLLEPWVLGRLVETIQEERCGFVGAFPAGLSYATDVRPLQQAYERWDGPVTPEIVRPDGPGWERHHLHRAANIWHAASALPRGEHIRYRVAWIAQCCVYDREKLIGVGGFDFWPKLPRYASGEDVLVQLLLLQTSGGCGILPSGTYHQEVPTTVLNSGGTVDGHALDLLPEMLARLRLPA